MLKVSYQIGHAPFIIDQIADQIPFSYQDETYVHESPAIQSRIKVFQLDNHLSCMISRFRVTELTRVERLASKRNLLLLDFHFSEKVPLYFPDNKESTYLIFGAYFTTDTVRSFADFSNNNLNQQVAIFIDKQEALSLISHQNHSLNQLIKHNSYFHHFREISYELAKEIKELQQIAFEKVVLKSLIHGQVLKVLAKFFLSFRLKESIDFKLHEKDLEEILFVGNFIDKNVESSLKLKLLLEQTSMSETKFRKHFRVVYGKSPQQYIKQKKLWHAKTLIESGETVSSAAYSIGYTNLSYFTRSFNEQFSINPMEYKKIILQKSGR